MHNLKLCTLYSVYRSIPTSHYKYNRIFLEIPTPVARFSLHHPVADLGFDLTLCVWGGGGSKSISPGSGCYLNCISQCVKRQ